MGNTSDIKRLCNIIITVGPGGADGYLTVVGGASGFRHHHNYCILNHLSRFERHGNVLL